MSDLRENFCFVGYDPDRAIGYFVQLSRWRLDSAIWREQVQIFLPDGQYLLHRGWGPVDDLNSSEGALLKLTSDESGKRWRIRYRGPARLTSAAELMQGPLEERTPSLLDLDATFESEYCVWQMGERPTDDKWGHTHSEQPGKIHGRLEADGQTFDIRSTGYRSHSRGSRTLTSLFDHCWIHGVFSGGRAFAILHVRMKSAGDAPTTALAQAMIWNEGRIYPAQCTQAPVLGETGRLTSDPPVHFSFALESELGLMHVEAQAMSSIPHSTTMDGEWLDGVVTDSARAHLVAYERPTVFRWNGETGSGHVEQSRRI